MCTRYYIDNSPKMQEIISEMNRSSFIEKWHQTSGITTKGEIFPTGVVPVIASNKAGKRAVFPMKWGFTGKTLLLNARSETAATKPTFKDSWESHRCIVPASWYFEWEHSINSSGKTVTGDKYLIQPKGSDLTWLCGIYRMENSLPYFVILTCEAVDEIRFIHDRMPLIMPGELVDEWIRPDARPDMLMKKALKEMVYEKAAVTVQSEMIFDQ